MDFPPYSPDFNPIDNSREHLKTEKANHSGKPQEAIETLSDHAGRKWVIKFQLFTHIVVIIIGNNYKGEKKCYIQNKSLLRVQ